MSVPLTVELKPVRHRRLWRRSLIQVSLIALIATIAGCAIFPSERRERYLCLRASVLSGRDVSSSTEHPGIAALPHRGAMAAAEPGSRVDSPE